MTFLERVPLQKKLINSLIISDFDWWSPFIRSILGIMKFSSLKLRKQKYGNKLLVSPVVVYNYVEVKLINGMNWSSTLTRFSTMIVRKQLLHLALQLTKMQLMNHGVSENTSSSMKLNKNAPFSILNVDSRVLHMNSAEDRPTLKKTVYHPLSDPLKSHHKAELHFMKIMITKEKRSFTLKVLNVLKNMISNYSKWVTMSIMTRTGFNLIVMNN